MQDNKNKIIDELLQKRQDGMVNFAESTKKLIDLGVKIANPEGEISVPSFFEQFLDKYNNSNLEFEWEVIYKDGSRLRQYDGEDQHNFGNIKLDEVKSVSYISNFAWQTDNQDQRVIVTLNMETGLFTINNGFCPQEVLAEIAVNEIKEDKKLILFTRKRQSSSMGDVSDEVRQYFPSVGESFFYNRFILGFETPSGYMRAVIIDPNGNISLFNK